MTYRLKTPTLDKLSRIVGHEASSWEDAKQELCLNRITKLDLQFLTSEDAETYRFYKSHSGRSYSLVYVDEMVEKLEGTMRKLKTRFLLDACKELYIDEQVSKIEAVGESLKQRAPLLHSNASSIIDGRYPGTSTASAYGWVSIDKKTLTRG